MFRIAALLALLILPCAAQQPYSPKVRDYSNSLAPYVPSPQQIVDRMLEAAQLKPGEMLYDLGCGDGRILVTAAQKYQARAVGVEISEHLVRSTNETVKRLKLQDLGDGNPREPTSRESGTGGRSYNLSGNGIERSAPSEP